MDCGWRWRQSDCSTYPLSLSHTRTATYLLHTSIFCSSADHIRWDEVSFLPAAKPSGHRMQRVVLVCVFFLLRQGLILPSGNFWVCALALTFHFKLCLKWKFFLTPCLHVAGLWTESVLVYVRKNLSHPEKPARIKTLLRLPPSFLLIGMQQLLVETLPKM